MRKLIRFLKNMFSRERRELIHEMTEKNFNNLKWILELQKRNTFRIVEVELIRKRPFYDSTWKVYYMENGELATENVVTRSSCKERLYKGLSSIQSGYEIPSLDQRNTIYYD